MEIERADIGYVQKSGHTIEGVGFYGSSEEFIELCDRNLIADRIMSNLGIDMRETTSEFRSWREGLYRLSVVLREYGKSLNIACEVPTQAGMVDALIGGLHAEDGSPFFLVVELQTMVLRRHLLGRTNRMDAGQRPHLRTSRSRWHEGNITSSVASRTLCSWASQLQNLLR